MSDNWVQIKCDVILNCTNRRLDLVFKLHNNNKSDIESFFKSKVYKIKDKYELLEKGLEDITILCERTNGKGRRGEKYLYNNNYSFLNDGTVKKYWGDETSQVNEYLKGEIKI